MIEALAARIKTIEQRLARVERAEAPFYAKGTWTPLIQGATTAGTTTYTVQAGTYTRVGRLVTVSAHTVWTAATGTGQIQMTGLPFALANITNGFVPVTVRAQNVNHNGGTSLQGYIAPGVAYIVFEAAVTSAPPALVTFAAGTGALMIAATYPIS